MTMRAPRHHEGNVHLSHVLWLDCLIQCDSPRAAWLWLTHCPFLPSQVLLLLNPAAPSANSSETVVEVFTKVVMEWRRLSIFNDITKLSPNLHHTYTKLSPNFHPYLTIFACLFLLLHFLTQSNWWWTDKTACHHFPMQTWWRKASCEKQQHP